MKLQKLILLGLLLVANMAVERTLVAQDNSAQRPMELLVTMANANVPGGLLAPEGSIGKSRPTAPASAERAAEVNADIARRAALLTVPLRAERSDDVWRLIAQGAPEEVLERMARPRYLASAVHSTVSDAVFRVVAGILREKEMGGVLGAGPSLDERCALGAQVTLSDGATSVMKLLDTVVHDVPGLVWFVTYDESTHEFVSLGLICPGGQFARILLS